MGAFFFVLRTAWLFNGSHMAVQHGDGVARAWQTSGEDVANVEMQANAWQTYHDGKRMANAWQTHGKGMANAWRFETHGTRMATRGERVANRIKIITAMTLW